MMLSRLMAILLSLCCSEAVWALDSYRYMHVTIETPWMIFLVLLPIVLSPFILMAILYWRFAGRKPDNELRSSLRDKPRNDEEGH